MLKINYVYLDNDRRYIKKCMKKYLHWELHWEGQDHSWYTVLKNSIKSNSNIKNILIDDNGYSLDIFIFRNKIISYMDKNVGHTLLYMNKLKVVKIK